MSYHVFTLEVEVDDAQVLFEAAFKHAIEHDKLAPDQAKEMLNPVGEIDIDACLTMLVDPGSMDGCSIVQSSCEYVLP